MSDRIVREMRVQLTDAERLAKAQELARSGFELTQLEEEKAAAVSDFGQRLKALKARQSRLCYDVESGTELRDVECEERARYRDLCVDTIVIATGEVLSTRPMTPDERQTRMNLIQLRPRKPDDDPDEPDPNMQH